MPTVAVYFSNLPPTLISCLVTTGGSSGFGCSGDFWGDAAGEGEGEACITGFAVLGCCSCVAGCDGNRRAKKKMIATSIVRQSPRTDMKAEKQSAIVSQPA
jgi:hypothetical protein